MKVGARKTAIIVKVVNVKVSAPFFFVKRVAMRENQSRKTKYDDNYY